MLSIIFLQNRAVPPLFFLLAEVCSTLLSALWTADPFPLTLTVLTVMTAITFVVIAMFMVAMVTISFPRFWQLPG
jgi:hypothetical protein